MRFLWFKLPSIKVWFSKCRVVKRVYHLLQICLQILLLPAITAMLNLKWKNENDLQMKYSNTWPPVKEISSRNHSFRGTVNLVFTARSSPWTRCIWICKWPKRKIKPYEYDKNIPRSKWSRCTFSTVSTTRLNHIENKPKSKVHF